MQRAWIAVAEVAEEIRLHVPFGKEFLIATEARLAGGKELFVHLRMVEAGHGTTIETERPRGHDEVRALEARIPLRSGLKHVGVALKQLRHAGVVREQFGQLQIKLHVVRDNHGDRSGHRLLDVERRQRRAQPFLRFL